jgi:TP901 family phage tail tape measure protein
MSGKSYSVRLTADIADYRAKMNEAQSTARDTASQGGRSFTELGAKMQAVGSTMTKAVTLPLIGVGAGAVKMSMDFDTSMTKMQTMVGLSADTVDGFRTSIMSLAGETAQSPKALADALFVLTSAGLRGEEALEALEYTAKSSALGLGDMTDIARAVSGAVNAYGSDVLSAATATDVFAAAARAGNFDTAQLAGSIGQALPWAAQAKVSFEDLAGGIALLTRTNGDAAASTTQMSALMRAFVAPAAEAAKALDDVGMSTADLQAIIAERGLPAALQHLLELFGGNTEKLLKFIGSSEGGAAALAILEADAATLADTFGVTAGAAGLVDEAFGVVSETAGFQMSQAFVKLQTAMIQFGDILLPMVASAAEGVSWLGDRLQMLPEPIQKAVVGMGLLAAAVGPLSWGIGALIANLGQIKTALLALRAVIIGHPLLTLAAVIGGVAAAVSIMSSKTSEAAKSWNEVKDSVKAFAEEALKTSKDPLQSLQDRITALVLETPLFASALEGLGLKVQDVTAAIAAGGPEANRMIADIRQMMIATGEFDSSSLDLINTLFLMNGMYGELVTQWETAQGVLSASEEVVGKAAEAHSDLADRIGDARISMGMFTDVVSTGDPVIDGLMNRMNASISALEAWDANIRGALESGAQSFARFEVDSTTSIAEFQKQLGTNAWDVTVWGNDLLAIGAATSPEFAAFLAEMGAAGAPMVADLANNGAALQETFDAWVGYSSAMGRDLTGEMAQVSPEAQRHLETLRATTAAQLIIMAADGVIRGGEVGKAITAGIAAGIASNSSLVSTAVTGIVRRATIDARNAAEVRSPSRLFARELGVPIAEGIAVGINEGAVTVTAAVAGVVAGAANDLSPRSSNDIGFEFGAALGEGVAQGVTSTEAVVGGAITQMTDDALKQLDEAMKAWSATITNGQASFAGIEVDNTTEGGLWSVEGQLYDQTRSISEWATNLETIAETTSAGFVEWLASYGEKGFEFVRRLAEDAIKYGEFGELPGLFRAWEGYQRALDADIVSGIIQSLTGGISLMTGGPVPGTRGQAVPITAHGGEFVLSADVVEAIKRGGTTIGLGALGGGNGYAAGPTVVHHHYHEVNAFGTERTWRGQLMEEVRSDERGRL